MAAPSSVHRVLVLDDDEVMHDLLDVLLSMGGFAVTKATSGEEALALLRSDPGNDLVLTDLNMPGLEGEALVHALRGALEPKTLLIGMSSSEPAAGTLEALDAFLLKPFDLDMFRDAVESARIHSAALRPPEQVRSPKSATTQAESPAGDAAVLNEGIFDSLAKMIPLAQLGELYAMTLTDIEKRQSRIRDAAIAGDLGTAQREAHAIKGSCGMVGATELQALAGAIEGGTTLDVAALEEIPAACLRLRRMLDTKLQTA